MSTRPPEHVPTCKAPPYRPFPSSGLGACVYRLHTPAPLATLSHLALGRRELGGNHYLASLPSSQPIIKEEPSKPKHSVRERKDGALLPTLPPNGLAAANHANGQSWGIVRIGRFEH